MKPLFGTRSRFSASLPFVLSLATAFAPVAALASPFGVEASLGHPAKTRASFGLSVAEGSTVLGLEGEDAEAAAALTSALRKQLAKRGATQAQDMTLAELKLTMGCDDGDLACIAGGGQSMETGELIYGKLEGSGGDYTLTLTVLDVEKAKVVNGLTTTLDAAALSGEALDATAADLVVRLLGPGEDGATPTGAAATTGSGDTVPPPTETGSEGTPGEGTGEEGPSQSSKSEKSGGLVWGMERPPATWKIVGLGVSGGLMLASLGTAIGSSLAIRNPNGSVYKDLIAEAEKSLEDENPRNDIDPDTDGDLCELAREEPPDMPGLVTNASMTQVCNKADALAKTATATYITTGIFGASTVVFTVLLFTHKKKSDTAAKLLERGVQVGIAPDPRGGVSVGGGFRF